jgi:adenylate cyclase
MTATTSAPQTVYRLADLVVDVAQRRVTRDGVGPIELSALNFDLLRILVESAPNVVTYDELAEKVWGRHFVSPENVAQRVKLLRDGLSDDATEPRYIETVRSKGYRLIPSVQVVSSSPPSATACWRPWLATAAAALLLAVGGVYFLGPRPAETVDAGPHGPLPSSVAILPLQNLSPDAADAYFATGIHAEIISQLGKVPGLFVIAQTTVQRYANPSTSIPEIAAELNVETVMEGSVRYSGDRVRITTNLIDAATGASRWSEVYDRELGEVFAIQDEIATSIAEALGTKFPLPHRASTHGQATTSPEAAALYLKVLTVQSQCSDDAGVLLPYLDSATAFDPNFANAYAMKATAYASSVVDCHAYRARGAEEHAALEKLALDNAAIALKLDPTSTQAYIAIARVHQNFWRWSHAIDAYEKAYELSPNDVEVLVTFGRFLSWCGHHDRAIALLERATQIDPDSPDSHMNLGITLLEAGRTARALTVFRAAAPLAPTSPDIRFLIGRMEAISGDAAQALTEFQAAERLMPLANPSWTIALLYSYSLIGRSEDVRRLASTVKAMENTGPVGAGTWAAMYLALGDVEQAHHWVTLAVEKVERHEPDAGFLNLMAIKTNPYRNPVLDEPRFRALRDRIGVLD